MSDLVVEQNPLMTASPTSSRADEKISAGAELSGKTSMGKGVLRLACFFALIFMLIFALNAIINMGLRRITTSEFGAENQMMQGKVNADIVVTGSSRALRHYDPRLI